MKHYHRHDGYTYYFKDGELWACPTFVDESLDIGNELPIEDFVEPLNQFEIADITFILEEV